MRSPCGIPVRNVVIRGITGSVSEANHWRHGLPVLMTSKVSGRAQSFMAKMAGGFLNERLLDALRGTKVLALTCNLDDR